MIVTFPVIPEITFNQALQYEVYSSRWVAFLSSGLMCMLVNKKYRHYLIHKKVSRKHKAYLKMKEFEQMERNINFVTGQIKQ